MIFSISIRSIRVCLRNDLVLNATYFSGRARVSFLTFPRRVFTFQIKRNDRWFFCAIKLPLRAYAAPHVRFRKSRDTHKHAFGKPVLEYTDTGPDSCHEHVVGSPGSQRTSCVPPHKTHKAVRILFVFSRYTSVR